MFFRCLHLAEVVATNLPLVLKVFEAVPDSSFVDSELGLVFEPSLGLVPVSYQAESVEAGCKDCLRWEDGSTNDGSDGEHCLS